METGSFWEIVDRIRIDFVADDSLSQQNIDAMELRYFAELENLDPYKITAFLMRVGIEISQLNTFDFFAIYNVIEGWESLDGFYEFQNWVITLGSYAFVQILADPDKISEYAYVPGDRLCAFDFKIGERIIEKKTNTSPDLPGTPPDSRIRGVRHEIAESTFSQKFPNVWKRFWDLEAK